MTLAERTETGGIMPRVNGKPFRCPCGCNVFHKGRPHNGYEVLACNACLAEYETEKRNEPLIF